MDKKLIVLHKILKQNGIVRPVWVFCRPDGVIVKISRIPPSNKK